MKTVILLALLCSCAALAVEPTAIQKQAFASAVAVMDEHHDLPGAVAAFTALKAADPVSPFVASGEVEARILAARSREVISRGDPAECSRLEADADAVRGSPGFTGYGSSAKESILRHRYLLAERSGGGRFQAAFRDYALQYQADFIGSPAARRASDLGPRIDCLLWAVRKLDSPAKEELISKVKESISSGADEGFLIMDPDLFGRDILPLFGFEEKKDLLRRMVINVPVTVRSKPILEFAKGEYLKLKDL